jgi:hypothetical protein
MFITGPCKDVVSVSVHKVIKSNSCIIYDQVFSE